jgi:hypothetical protein
MADETLEARRLLRQRLSEIAAQYPEMTDTEHQQRLEAELGREVPPVVCRMILFPYYSTTVLPEKEHPMPYKHTGRDVGRPKTYQRDEERPVTVSVRIPRDVYDRVERYVQRHPGMTLTEFLLDGAQLRLDTPADPRDLILSDDNTVMREVQEMIRAAVQAEVGTLREFMGRQLSTPAPEAAPQPVPELPHDDNTVIQEGREQTHEDQGAPPPGGPVLEATPQGQRPGRPRNRRSRILALLQAHPRGLTEEQLTAELRARQTIGPLLADLVREHEVTQRSRGRYVLASPQAPGLSQT